MWWNNTSVLKIKAIIKRVKSIFKNGIFWSPSQYKEVVYKDKLCMDSVSLFFFSFHNRKNDKAKNLYNYLSSKQWKMFENRSNATESFHKDLIFLMYI